MASISHVPPATDQERKSLQRHYYGLLGIILGFALLLAALTIFGGKFAGTHPLRFAGALISLVAAYVVASVRMGAWAKRMYRTVREEQAAQGERRAPQRAWEYRSSLELFGLPLVQKIMSEGDPCSFEDYLRTTLVVLCVASLAFIAARRLRRHIAR